MYHSHEEREIGREGTHEGKSDKMSVGVII
jgi:hypothetical protein